MRHRHSGRQLNRTSSHRKAMFSNMTSSLVEHEIIKTTLAKAEVLADFNAKGVTLLRADWTRRDPAVTAALASLGRNGVPVYALYQNGQPATVLSEVLSVDDVRSALAGL